MREESLPILHRLTQSASGNHGPVPTDQVPMLVLAYHFFPSAEVGAKRISALTAALNHTGSRVAVFSAFDGLDPLQAAMRQPPLCNYENHRIPDVPSPVRGLLVSLKGYVRLLRRTPGRDLDDMRSVSVSSTRINVFRAIVRKLFALIHVIDDKKRWSWNAARRVLASAVGGEWRVIIVSGPPMSSLWAALWAGQKAGIPVVADLRDPIWFDPSERDTSGGRMSLLGRRALERYVLKRASRVITTSTALCKTLQLRYPEAADRVCAILNGYDDEPVPALTATDNRLVIVYAGALYLNRDPFPFLEALERLLTNPGVDASRIELMFAGSCEQYQGVSLRNWLCSRRCGGITSLFPQLGAPELKQLYARSTVLLNFAEGQRLQVPAKTFELLALGREIVTFCEPGSATWEVLSGISGVWCVEGRETARLDQLLLTLYRRHVLDGRADAPKPGEIGTFSRTVQNERFIDVIRSVVFPDSAIRR